MVAGMTPTTVKVGFVSAVLEAGYHVLAGGGHYSPEALRAKVAEIQGKISSGIGLTLNSLYINLRQLSFQLPLWQDMCREGLPIEGFCVAAASQPPRRRPRLSVVSSLLGSVMSHSTPVQWTASAK
jgi:fatty acid synthase subunit alpha, fungi type